LFVICIIPVTGQKKQAALANGLLKRRIKNNIQSDCAFFAKGTYGTDAKRQQHQGARHDC